MNRITCSLFSLSLILMVPSFSERSSKALAQAVAPSVSKVRPDTIAAGSPTFTLRLKGKHFSSSGARVLFDGATLESSRVISGEQALAEIDRSLIAVSGVHTVQIVNPDGLATEKRTLTVVESDPELQIRLEGDAVQEGENGQVDLEVTGDAFRQKASKIYVSGVRASKTFISETRIRLTIPSSLTQDAAYLPVIIIDKQAGKISNTEIFFVVPNPPVLESLDPETVDVGTDRFNLEVRGSGFKAGARILINGTYLDTTSPRSGLLEATVPGPFRASAGQLFVRVEQEGTQSSNLNILVPPTTEPFIFTASPTVIRQGEDLPTIFVVATRFGEKSKLFIDGQSLEQKNLRMRSTTLIKVRLPDELLVASGSHTVQIFDRNGNPSNVSSFSVVADVTVETLVGGKHEGLNSERCAPRDDAFLRRPSRLAVGAAGLIYVVDYQNHMIRSVDSSTGEVCSIAGTGDSGYSDSGDSSDFPPTFSYPLGIALRSDGVIFVSDNGNNVIRRIRPAGANNVTVDTYAGANLPVDDSDIQKRRNSMRLGLEGFRDGGVRDAAFRKPDDMVIASDGSIYLSDAGNHSIRRIRPEGEDLVVQTIAGNGAPGFADGDAVKARFNAPTGLALSQDGRILFVADTNNHRIRTINLTTLRVDTLAGSGDQGDDDGPFFVADFNQPTGLALDSDGTLFVSEVSAGRIRRVDSLGNVSVVAGRFDSSVNKNRDGSGVKARFNGPRGITLDAGTRNLYVADLENSAIRKIALPRQ